MEWAEQFGLAIPEIVDFKATFGRGVEGTLAAEFRAVESVKMTALRRYFMPETERHHRWLWQDNGTEPDGEKYSIGCQ